MLLFFPALCLKLKDELTMQNRTRLEQARLEQDRLEKARLEQDRLEKARLERTRLEQARLEQRRLEQARLEQARLEQAKQPPQQPIAIEIIDTPGTWSWADATAQAQAADTRLPTHDEVRRHLAEHKGKPLFAMDIWWPVGDAPNAWVSVGNYDPVVRLGNLHEHLGGPPGWGTTNEYHSFRSKIAFVRIVLSPPPQQPQHPPQQPINLQGSWKCSFCLFINPVDNFQCATCTGPKPPAELYISSSPPANSQQVYQTGAPPRAVEKKDCPMSFEDFAGATANDILIDTAWKCRVCQLLPALHLRKACVDTSYANAVTGVLQGVELQPMGIPMGMNINIVGLNAGYMYDFFFFF